MRTKKITAILVLFFSLGCSHRVHMKQLPPNYEDFLPSEVGILVPAILKTPDIRINRKVITPDEEFTQLVLQKIQRTHVFLEVSSADRAGTTKRREKAVHLDLSVMGVIDTNIGMNQLKLALNVVTLFLFSSALEYKDEFDVSMELNTRRYDGKERFYRSRISGEILYRAFGGEAARQEALNQVVTKSLNSLMYQVMQDVDFFAMEDR